ncbi:hypothetical protein E4T66_09570 [Sinimarinibacterium sp. CAU 1509]|uniref:hypothetical protein n=1 Tax=Sinimarinibacterium sp. CAU 1509 TaxID=2562283 RepID=UPI0010AC863A|nr:hypothetical protein [Sinimarinibacterium sp. CAU 1509]TJY60895.1 hypothetical protein E4T66_09570 [Sinimarinibacterium sp. CAU 1509]
MSGAEVPESLPATAPRSWEPLSLLPIAVGLYWLLADQGIGWLLLSALPGCVLLAAGMVLLLVPGDPRVPALMALGAVLGVLLTPLVWLVSDFETLFYTVLGSLACVVVAGRIGLQAARRYADAPEPDTSTEMNLKAALDEAMLGFFVVSARMPSGTVAERMLEDVQTLEQAITDNGWFDDPSLMHAAPPAPEHTQIERARLWGSDYEVLRYDSDFVAPPGLPRASWLQAQTNSGCHVRILRHPGAARPWMLCLHGYRMGMPWMDLGLFPPAWLHEKLGLNVIQPVLPLHGPRRVGSLSGGRYLDGDLLDLVLAQAQALWDIRRSLAWLRAHEPDARVGVYGISLGGFNAALLSAYEAGLDFVVAGIPVIDLASALWGFLPPAHLDYFTAGGIDEARYRRLLSVVSPLSRPPLPSRERLHIFAGAGDLIVSPRHPLELSRHWQVPVSWYQGSHLSIRSERISRQVVAGAIREAGWP